MRSDGSGVTYRSDKIFRTWFTYTRYASLVSESSHVGISSHVNFIFSHLSVSMFSISTPYYSALFCLQDLTVRQFHWSIIDITPCHAAMGTYQVRVFYVSVIASEIIRRPLHVLQLVKAHNKENIEAPHCRWEVDSLKWLMKWGKRFHAIPLQ